MAPARSPRHPQGVAKGDPLKQTNRLSVDERVAAGKALRDKSCAAATFEARKRNHMTVIINAIDEADPVAQRVLGFIAARVTLHRLETEGVAGVDFLANFIALSGGK